MLLQLQEILARPLIKATVFAALAYHTSAAPAIGNRDIIGNLHLPEINLNPHTTFSVGSSSILIGELSSYPGGFFQAITDALNSVCDPLGTSCDPTSPPTIGNINYGLDNANSIQTGTLTLTVTQSSYVGQTQRDALISLIATGFAQTATGDNCSPVTFQQGCRNGKRIAPDDGGAGGDAIVPDCETITVTNCNAATFASAAVIDTVPPTTLSDPLVQSAATNMDVTIAFTGSSNPISFDCTGFLDLITSNVDVLPAVADAADPVLGLVTAICKDVDAAS